MIPEGLVLKKGEKRRQKRRVFNPSFSQVFGPEKKRQRGNHAATPLRSQRGADRFLRHIPKTPNSIAWRKNVSASTLSAKTKATDTSPGYTIPTERLDTNQLVE
jgi:hypothetical protein